MTAASEKYLHEIYRTLELESPEPESPYRTVWRGLSVRKRRGILMMGGVQENELVYIEAQFYSWDELPEHIRAVVASQIDYFATELKIFAENLKIYQRIVADVES